MATLSDLIARGWENFLARPQGSLNFRFILQPTIAALLALRAGINDARAGRPAYLWAIFTEPAYRSQFLGHGWSDVRTPFFVSVILDVIYQLIFQRFVYPLELLFTATLLAVLPYVALRGLFNRAARRVIGGRPPTDRADKDTSR